jgi:hypothetical protein
MLLLVSGAAPAREHPEKLSEFDFLLLGLEVRPEPELQTVPRNTPTGLRVVVDFASAEAASTELVLGLLPQDLRVAAELVGPGLETPTSLSGAPGELLPIPPLSTKGLYTVRDIRLERGNGDPYLRASPDVATVEVIDRVLVTRVETRPLTLEEIRQKGILFGDDSFTGYNFRLALRLDSRPIEIDLPVVFDSNLVPVPLRETGSIDISGPGLPSVPTGVTPVLLKPAVAEIAPEVLAQIPADMHIPGLLVVPGDVGLLNQMFSAILLVSNGAPPGSSLAVRSLEGAIVLPVGEDGVEGTSDDPLKLAVTEGGPPDGESVAPIRGPSGEDRFLPGEQGQAEFLLEGRREGFHEIRFDITGFLEGLPVGPIPIEGVARGGVLVRNADFHLAFGVPGTVRAQEEFTLWLTVTNTSSAHAALVRVSLGAGLSGATLAPGEEETRSIEDLAPGESEAIPYRLIATQTGQVTASYLRVQEGTGSLLFRLGVGERGVPLSPDTIVLPSSVRWLASPVEVAARRNSRVVEAALRVLGQGLSIATAPPALLPEGVTPVSRQTVLDRATFLAEAGFRVQLGEPLERTLVELAMDFPGKDSPGFMEVLSETSAGRGFFDALGETLSEIPEVPPGVAALLLELAHELSSRDRHLLIGVDGPASASLAGASRVPIGTRELLVLPSLGASLYEVRLVPSATGFAEVVLNVPFVGGGTGVYVFEDVPVTTGIEGRITVDLRKNLDRLTLLSGSESFSSQPVRFFAPRGPRLLAATAIGPETLSGADPWGRLVALLFDREVRAAEAEDEGHYFVEENRVLSAVRQLSGRLVFLFLRDPVGNFVPRGARVEGLFDPAGKPMTPFQQSETILSLLADPGARVSGRVLNADGTPVPGAEVLYMNSTLTSLIGLSQKRVGSDGSYAFDWVRRSERGTFAVRATDAATGSIQELTTRVTENGEHIRMDLVLRGRGGVEGLVTATDGTPRPGARVLVTSRVDPYSFVQTTADGNGFYRAPGLVVGPFTVKAVHQVFSGVAAGNLLRAGAVARADVVLNQSQGRVRGHVYELFEGVVTEPLSDVEVYFVLPGNIVAAASRTDPGGAFVFEGMPTGTFHILAVDRVTSRQASSQTATLGAGGDLDDVDVFFSREAVGRVEGTVSDGTSSLAGALVDIAGRRVATTETGFVIEGVPVGTHTISASLPGTNRTARATVSVVEGAATRVDLRLSGTGRVVVQVFDAAGNAIEGQQVIRIGGNPCSGEARFTVSDGTATFDGITVPGATFKAIRGGDLAEGTAALAREGDVVLLVLRFRGFGTVFGEVGDENGPVLGADVALGALRFDGSVCSFVPDGRARQVRTDSLGRYRFENVPVGAVSVTATAGTGTSFPATAKDALVANGDVRELNLTLVDNVGGIVKGRVLLSDGKTPAGAGVRVSTVSNIGAELAVTTKADGSYEFAKILAPGRYDLFAHDPVSGRVAKETVYLQLEQDLVRDLRLLAEGAVVVEVLDGSGSPVDEAFVELEGASFPFDERAGAIVPTDQGEIRFDRVTEGSFSVTASSLGRGGRASGAVTAEGSTTRISLSLTSVGRLVGVLKTSDGSLGVPNGEILLKQGGSGRLLGATTTSSFPAPVPPPCQALFGLDALGLFELGSVPAGSLLVTATDPLTGRIGEASSRIAADGEFACVEVRLLGLGTLAGWVESGTERVGGAKVTLTSSTGLASPIANLTAEAMTGGNGAFRFEGIPVGSFTLQATVPGLLLTGTATGAISTDGQIVEDIAVALESSGSIDGIVTRAGGSPPVAGALVTLKPKKGVLRTQSGEDGSFFFDFVPSGSFTLTAEENGGFDQGLLDGHLDPGEDLEGVVLEMNGTGAIEGVALDSGGFALASGLVRLTTPAPFARSETATVDPAGSFRFLKVPVGSFQLALEVAGSPLRGVLSGAIASDGDVENVTIRLEPARPVFGRVVHDDGTTPAPNASVSIQSAGFELSDLTDASGSFRVEGVPLGNFTVRVEESLTSGVARAEGTLSEATPETGLDLGTLVLDRTPIAILSTSPADGATLVPPDAPVDTTFTDEVGSPSLVGLYSVASGAGNIAGSFEILPDGRTARFRASPSLPPRSVLTVTVSGTLVDVFGRALGDDETFSFTTGGAVLTGIVMSQGVPAAGATVTLDGGDSVTTDPSGRYRFENVEPGLASLLATHGSLAGSRLVDVLESAGVVTADLALAIVGSIAGTVTEWTGAPAPEGLTVRVSRAGIGIGLGTTLPSGSETRYLVENVPLGDLVVDVTNETNGDRGQRSALLLEEGVTLEVPVSMAGVSELRVEVKDSLGAPVEGASVTASLFRFGESRRHDGSTDASGVAVFPNVLTSTVSVTATSGSRSASGSVAVAPPGPTTLALTITSLSGLSGQVLDSDGVTPFEGASVGLFRGNSTFAERTGLTDSDGRFAFSDLPALEKAYRVDVLVNGRLRARARDVTIPEGVAAVVELVLAPVGTVTGLLTAPSPLSGNVTVTLQSFAPELGGTFTTTPGADDRYTISGVPPGPFQVTARDNVHGFRGETTSTMPAEVGTVQANVQLFAGTFSIPSGGHLLVDGNGARFRVQQSGASTEGAGSVFSSSFVSGGMFLELEVDEGTTRYAGGSLGFLEENGRELETPRASIAGLDVRRKVYVPADAYFARYLEILENPTGAPIAVTAHLVTNVKRGSGDAEIREVGNAGRFLVVDDGSDSDPFLVLGTIPSLAFALSGNGVVPAVEPLVPVGADVRELRVSYPPLVVPPGGRVVLMHVVSQQLGLASARAAAERVTLLPPELLVGLDASEIAGIVNFDVPPQGTSAVSPLPPRNGRASGLLLANDGLTPVGSGTFAGSIDVTFQSDHILFRRKVPTNSSTGAFEFPPSSSSLVIVRDGFTLQAVKTFGVHATSATARRDFTGASRLSHSPDAPPVATSQLSGNPAANVIDASAGTYWQPLGTDVFPKLTWNLSSPAHVTRIVVTPRAGSDMASVEAFGQVYDFDGSSPLEIDLDEPAVEQIVLSFVGNLVQVGDVTILGLSSGDAGSALEDLVFRDSAAVDVSVVSDAGSPVSAFLQPQIAGSFLGAMTSVTGEFFLAPLPPTVSLSLDAWSNVGHSFQRVTRSVAPPPLLVGTPMAVEIRLPLGATVSGRVTDNAGAGIPGQSLTLFGSASQAGTSTDANGDFLFREVPEGDYTLQMFRSGVTLRSSFHVSPPAPAVVNFQFQDPGRVNLQVIFESTDGSELNAHGAPVELTHSGGVTLTGNTNAGALSFFPVPPGPLTIRVRHPSVAVWTEASYVLPVGGQLDPLVRIPAFGTVRVDVVLGSGAAASGSLVELVGSGILPKATSNGTATFQQVRAAIPLDVVARHPAPGRGHIFVSQSITIPREGASLDVDLSLPATGTVVIEVKRQGTSTAIPGIDVFLRDSFQTAFRAEGFTDGSGAKTISIVPEGGFDVRIERGGVPLDERPGQIQVHGESVTVLFEISGNSTLSGVVFGGDGATPFPGARVELRSEDGSTLLEETFAASDGTYSFPDAVSPETTVLVRALHPFDETKQAEELVTSGSAGEPIEADLSLPISVVKGRVLEPDGVTPVPGTSVEISRYGRLGPELATTDEEGDFVFFGRELGVHELLTEDASGLLAVGRGELLSIDEALVVDLVLPAFGVVEVSVVDEAGFPLTARPVFLRSASLRSPRFAFASGDGIYRFDRVALGAFTVTYDEEIWPRVRSGAETSVLTELEPFAAVELALPGFTGLFGRLVEGGTPVFPSDEFTPLEIEGRKLESTSGIYQRSTGLDVDGQYDEENVPEGELTLTANEIIETPPIVSATTAVVTDELPDHEVNIERGGADGFPLALGPFFVEANGGLTAGPTSLHRALVNEKEFPWLASSTSGTLGPVRTSGVLHRREVHVNEIEQFARYLEVFENPHPFDVEIQVRLESFLEVNGTSSGDSEIDPSDRYVLAGPVASVFAGSTAGSVPPDFAGCDFEGSCAVTYRRLVVPAAGRLSLLHFTVLAATAPEARAIADGLASLTNPAALDGIDPPLLVSIVNFGIE